MPFAKDLFWPGINLRKGIGVFWTILVQARKESWYLFLPFLPAVHQSKAASCLLLDGCCWHNAWHPRHSNIYETNELRPGWITLTQEDTCWSFFQLLFRTYLLPHSRKVMTEWHLVLAGWALLHYLLTVQQYIASILLYVWDFFSLHCLGFVQMHKGTLTDVCYLYYLYYDQSFIWSIKTVS